MWHNGPITTRQFLTPTKEMVIDFKAHQNIPPLVLNNTPIEQVHTFKLLRLTISDNLSWKDNTNNFIEKGAPLPMYTT